MTGCIVVLFLACVSNSGLFYSVHSVELRKVQLLRPNILGKKIIMLPPLVSSLFDSQEQRTLRVDVVTHRTDTQFRSDVENDNHRNREKLCKVLDHLTPTSSTFPSPFSSACRNNGCADQSLYQHAANSPPAKFLQNVESFT